jgi:isopentenyl-diphosphate Delta-isomerase
MENTTKKVNNWDSVILVDTQDNELGIKEKLQAHLDGDLHRAFSIFIFNSKNELLLQQRALSKYHSPGLWTNTCCSHPQPGSTIESDIHERLMDEMGMVCELNYVDKFIYKAAFSNNLIEHELDYVYVGYSDKLPLPNPDEVHAYKYLSLENLQVAIRLEPEGFTPWLKIILEQMAFELEK